MRRVRIFVVVAAVALLRTAPAAGHGTPIRVDISTTEMSAGGGFADSTGFASLLFFEDDEDGDEWINISPPPTGPIALINIPGFEIITGQTQNDLRIELVARPVKNGAPNDSRVVWYWNPAELNPAEQVAPAPPSASLFLLGTGMRFQSIAPDATAAPPPFLLTDPIQGQQGFHNHSLVNYGIDNSPSIPDGAYGFFARLLSEGLTSDPFLIVLNRNVDYSQMVTAARAINAGAFLPGDYNHDDDVNAADYTVWRNSAGQKGLFLAADGNGDQDVDAADYLHWKANYSGSFGSGTFIPQAIPEPAAVVLFVSAASFSLFDRRRRQMRVA